MQHEEIDSERCTKKKPQESRCEDKEIQCGLITLLDKPATGNGNRYEMREDISSYIKQ